MSKKIKLSHQLPNGDIATRTTARDYSHVLLARRNDDKVNASLVRDYGNIEKRVEERRAELEKQHAIYRNILSAGLGNKVRNWNNIVVVVDEFYIQSAQRGLNDYGTIEEQCEERRNDLKNSIQKTRDHIANNAAEWQVVSWHGRRDLADKAAGSKRLATRDTRVEAINNGNRDA